MVDADYVEWEIGVAKGRNVGDGDGGFVECGGYIVDGDGVVRVCSVTSQYDYYYFWIIEQGQLTCQR